MEFTARNARVLGISRDTPENNRRFRDKFAFPYTLLSDVDGEVSLQYGTIANIEQAYPDRKTVLLDLEGRVIRVFSEVDPPTHPAKVLEVLKSLSQS